MPFLALPIILQYLLPAQFGQYALFLAYCNLVKVISGLGVRTFLARSYFNVDIRTVWIPFVRANVYLCIAIYLLIVVLLTIMFLAEIVTIEGHYVLMVLITGLSLILIELTLICLRVAEKAFEYSIIQVCISLVNTFFALWFVQSFEDAGYGRDIAFLLASVFGFLICFMVALRAGFMDNVKHVDRVIPKFYRGALGFFPHSLLVFLLSFGDRLLLPNFISLEQLGLFQFAFMFSSGYALFLDATAKWYQPTLYKSLSQNDAKYLVRRRDRQLILIHCICIALILIAVDPLLTVAFSEAYYPSKNLVYLLIVAQLVNGIYLISSMHRIYENRTFLVTVSTIVGAITYFGIILWFVGYIDIAAIGIASILSMLARVAVLKFGNAYRVNL